MSVYRIFENGEEINRIVADESFVKEYCPANSYTYELGPEPLEPGLNVDNRIAELKVNLSATDYQAIKYAEGLVFEEEYALIKCRNKHGEMKSTS